ncbi:GPMC system family 4 glycosyltransferase [Bacillaceae bacterium]
MKYNKEHEQIKVGFFTPYYRSPRGNSITAMRIVHGMRQFGYTVHLYAYLEEPLLPPLAEAMREASFYHILQASRFADWRQKHAWPLDKPYLVTMGGTDINHDIGSAEKSNRILELLDGAAAITVFTQDAFAKLQALDRGYEDKTQIIPQSVWLPQGHPPDRSAGSAGTEAAQDPPPSARPFPLILLPAGLRPVKDVLYLFDALKRLRRDLPALQFVIIGDILDLSVYHKVIEKSSSNPWFHYKGSVPFAEMRSWYERADLVVNSSVSEGQSLAVMEAMALGVPVLARVNGANESLIEEGKTGFLFTTPEEFRKKALRLFRNHDLRKRIAAQARAYIARFHSLEKEIAAYDAIYRVLGKTSPSIGHVRSRPTKNNHL